MQQEGLASNYSPDCEFLSKYTNCASVSPFAQQILPFSKMEAELLKTHQPSGTCVWQTSTCKHLFAGVLYTAEETVTMDFIMEQMNYKGIKGDKAVKNFLAYTG